jgi:hypothetical protein
MAVCVEKINALRRTIAVAEVSRRSQGCGATTYRLHSKLIGTIMLRPTGVRLVEKEAL